MNLNQQSSVHLNSVMLFNNSSTSNSTENSPEHTFRDDLVVGEPSNIAATNARDENQRKKDISEQILQQQQQQQPEEVKQVELYGVRIVALTIGGKERLCLAQISNTLLKDFSYNEIHNRRVALGITCVQCTPIQLEMLRRAGAMPSSSRRCGMITMREAERLCRSFLVEEQPPDLPENFYFTVSHRVNYGCKGRFVPARYISSRAKCIECFYCGEYYSPNKFIFHSHRHPHATDCNPPDSPNINSWRKHIDLDWSQEHSQEIKYAWEDVKSLFNGGTRRRTPSTGSQATNGAARSSSTLIKSEKFNSKSMGEDQLIDVEDLEGSSAEDLQRQVSLLDRKKVFLTEDDRPLSGRDIQMATAQSLILNQHPTTTDSTAGSVVRRLSSLQSPNQPPCKRLQTYKSIEQQNPTENPTTSDLRNCYSNGSTLECSVAPEPTQNSSSNVHPAMRELMLNPRRTQMNQSNGINGNQSSKCSMSGLMYSNTPEPFSIYGQLYSQLAQHQPASQLMPVETQLALRHHLWTSLLANLQTRGIPSQQPFAAPTNRAPVHVESNQSPSSQQTTSQQLNHLMPGIGHQQYYQQQQKQRSLQNPQFRSSSD